MWPGYKPPSRQTLSTKLLDTSYESVLLEINKRISNAPEACALTLSQNGWTSVNRDAIISTSVFCEIENLIYFHLIIVEVNRKPQNIVLNLFSKILNCVKILMEKSSHIFNIKN
jgi:hypothetical protein